MKRTFQPPPVAPQQTRFRERMAISNGRRVLAARRGVAGKIDRI